MVDIVTAGLVLGAVLAGLFLGLLLGRGIAIRTMELGFAERESAARKDAVRRSRAVFGGQALERLAPQFPDFPFNPKDLRFVGDPIDYVVFDGLTEGTLHGIVFLEVKSGTSNLKDSQREVRQAIEDGAVSWRFYRVPAEFSETT